MSKKITAKARVQVTLDIECMGGTWGEECSIGQLQKQAAEDALNQLKSIFTKENVRNISILGEPKVMGVITQGE